jgi:hypothetical protein
LIISDPVLGFAKIRLPIGLMTTDSCSTSKEGIAIPELTTSPVVTIAPVLSKTLIDQLLTPEKISSTNQVETVSLWSDIDSGN